LAGEVIGVNTATVLQAQSIGFAVPVEKVKRDVDQVKTLGKIVYPFLGIQYSLITERLKEERALPISDGAYISKITPDSSAAKAGLKNDDIILQIKEKDIIIEFNKEKITKENSLAKIIQRYNPGDIVTLRVMREGALITLQATLGERSE
jgi:S1-C subfamily serine protease